MSDLNETFQQKIQDNPSDELARYIYADWLEEQGNSKSILIRLFNSAVAGDQQALKELLERCEEFSLVGELPRLAKAQLAIDIAWTFRQVQGHRPSRRLLTFRWYNLLGTLSDEAYLNLSDTLWMATTIAHEAATTGRITWADISSPLFYKQSLIAISYYLFGTNVLPDSFVRTGFA